MDNYVSFLRARGTAERAIGRYIVEMTEKGHGLAWFTAPAILAVQGEYRAADAAIIKGSDRDLISAVSFCGLSRKRRNAAMAVLREELPTCTRS